MTNKENIPTREQVAKKSKELALIINPLRTASYEVDMEWRWFRRQMNSLGEDYGGLDYTPDFQRGHVWSEQQQTRFIENVLRGVIGSAGFQVQFNCPNWDNFDYEGDLPRGFQCIDGLQRITAINKFLDGEIKPFGLSASDLDGSSFNPHRSMFRFRVAVHNFERKADLLTHYLDINSGGTPHSKEELDRVAAMRDGLKPKLGSMKP